MSLGLFRVLNTGGGSSASVSSGAVVGTTLTLTKSDATTVPIDVSSLKDSAFVTSVPAATASSTPLIVDTSTGRLYFRESLGAGVYVYTQISP